MTNTARNVGVMLGAYLTLALSTVARGDNPLDAIITPTEAARHGLARAWIMQVEIDQSRDRVQDIVLVGDLLLVHSKRGVVQAIDAETGGTNWVRQVGAFGHHGFAPDANAAMVAVVRDTSVFLISREGGVPIAELDLRGAPAAPPAMNDRWLYVTMISGQILGFDLNALEEEPWRYIGAGAGEARPLITPDRVAWGTSRGFIYANVFNKSDVQFEVATSGPITAPLAFAKPHIYAASHDEFVYALDAQSGSIDWSFAAGGPHRHQPVALDDAVYVFPDVAGMYCLDAGTGARRWWTAGVAGFVAASPVRLYVTDELGNLIMLDRSTGARADTMGTRLLNVKLINTQNDRLYLATSTGMMICLHEFGLDAPVELHPAPAPEAKAAAPEAKAAAPGDEAAPADAKPGPAAP